MDVDTLKIILAIVVQTVAIGIFIGNIKTVVTRLVKDVEEIGSKIVGFMKDLVEAKKDIKSIEREQARHDHRIEMLEQRVTKVEVSELA